ESVSAGIDPTRAARDFAGAPPLLPRLRAPERAPHEAQRAEQEEQRENLVPALHVRDHFRMNRMNREEERGDPCPPMPCRTQLPQQKEEQGTGQGVEQDVPRVRDQRRVPEQLVLHRESDDRERTIPPSRTLRR